MKDHSKFIGRQYGHFTVLDVVKARSGANHYEFKVECVCGKQSYSRQYMLEHGKHISCGCKGIPSLSKWDHFGKWTIINDVSGKGGRQYECQCECGNIKTIQLSDLVSGSSRGCQGCANNKILGSKRKHYVPYGKVYGAYKRNARKVGREFSLTIEEAQSLFTSACYYCLSEPSTRVNQKVEELWYNGIDRLDNSIGYTKENCVPCCKFCNYAKHTRSAKEYQGWLMNTALRLTEAT